MTDVGPAFTFLTVEDVLSLHADAINTWGGTHGIRDRGLLESAVGAATNVALYDEAADIYDVAAAYAYHVAQNQPFLDGNKRAGLAAAAAFLFMNGVDLPDREEADESVLAKSMIDVAGDTGQETRDRKHGERGGVRFGHHPQVISTSVGVTVKAPGRRIPSCVL